MKIMELDWKVGFTRSKEMSPEKTVKANVPGNAQLDWMRENKLAPYNYSDNFLQYEWMEDVFWIYESALPGKDGDLIFKGIDYEYEIYVDGVLKLYHEGMFTSVKVRVNKGDKDIKVVIFPVPKRKDAPKGRWQADRSAKPPVAYGWDWHPRLIPSGIWEECRFVIGGEKIINPSVTYKITEDLSEADVTVSCGFSAGDMTYTLKDATGKTVFSSPMQEDQNLHFTVKNPYLWWCNEQGEQYLYHSEFELKDFKGQTADIAVKKTGFKKIRLIPQAANWAIDQFPFTQATPPVTIELNNRQIFAKGSNWVNPEIYTGTITYDTYYPLIKLAADGHFNIFRCWGGAIVNKESFFDICDEMGIMVWQEFPLACNCYKDDEAYLKILDNESRAVIERLRQHASHALWCGGNELYTGGSSMTEQFKALRLLNSNCYRFDEDKPFLHTSPILGMRHGHYMFRYPDGKECFEGFQSTKATAFTEFGCPAPSDLEYLKTFIPEDELHIPVGEEKSWIAHHGLMAWEKQSWLHLHNIEYYFGKCKDLEDMIVKGQILQSAGYKSMFEEARRQKPNCSMSLNWCYNEPWETAANNTLVNYPHRPRKSYYDVKESLKNTVASARVKKFSYEEGEYFEAELFMLNDAYLSQPGGAVKAYIRMNGDSYLALEWNYGALQAGTNIYGPTVRFKLPHYKSGIFRLCLECGNAEFNNEYSFIYYNAETARQRVDVALSEKPMDFVGISSAPKEGMVNIDTIVLKK